MIPAGFVPSRVHDQRFAVSFDYPVVFCRGVFDRGEPSLAWAIGRREPSRQCPVSFVLDAGLVAANSGLTESVVRYADRYSASMRLRGEPIIVVGGEASKNDPALVAELCRQFRALGLDRHAAVIAVGGGAVLDAVGYAAAIVHRGIRIVRMPSTVLSQCDGGVGVKNGVNAFGAKNFLGTFAPPFAVVNDSALLQSLSLRDARAGMAEAVKVALIRDPKFFEWLEINAGALAQASSDELTELVRWAARIHLNHIAEGGDPFELGSSRPLDYGHWAAHKLEMLTRHELRHGEAVAIGMLLDARYAERIGILSSAELTRIDGLLRALGLPRYHPALSEREGGKLAVLAGLEEFREHLGGALTVTLLTGVGGATEVSDIDGNVVSDCIAWMAEHGSA